MSCEYHRNITFILRGTVGEKKRYIPPIGQTAFNNIPIIWFRKYEIRLTEDVPELELNVGQRVKLYDFAVKGKPETRSIISSDPDKNQEVLTSCYRKNMKTTRVFCIKVMETV